MPGFRVASWAGHVAGSYAAWLNRKSRKARLVNRYGPDFAKIYFPQHSTGDQSFYIDQTAAFIGLSFLEGRELAAAVRSAP